MICDRCIDRDDCRIRVFRGKHIRECKSFFPDLLAGPEEAETEDRSPRAPMTPENRARPIQTREV